MQPLRFIFLAAPPAVLERRIAGGSGHDMPPSLLPSRLPSLQLPRADEDAVAVAVAVAVDATLRAQRSVDNVLAQLRACSPTDH